MQMRLPIGIDSFEKIRTNDFFYVDKTMFIAELLQDWGEVNLFTRPRRFGRSLNMSMLKAFFEIGNDKKLFDGLKIIQERGLCEKYMGKFPVVAITLKSVEGMDFAAAKAALRNVIGKEALRFQFLLESVRLSEREKKMYSQLIEVGNEEQAIFSMSDAALADSLRTLSQILSKHYGQKTILLIDEYDVPLDKAFQAGYYDEMASLARRLFGSALKTNEDLYFAVLTGCLRISKESIFTGLNNLKTHTVTDCRYDEHFGFTEKDVNEILVYYDLTDHGDALREWYDGYQFGNTGVYCPWDVIDHCTALLADPDTEPENYWANTSGNAMVRRFIGKAGRQTKSEIERLIAGKSIVKPINQGLTYSELDQSIDNLWSVLFTTGYLTQRGKSSGGKYELVIPNREIRDLFIRQIQEWFKDETRADPGQLERFCAAFPRGDAAVIEELLSGYLWRSISVRDTAVRTEMKENFYHRLLLGLLQYASDWEIESNAGSGEGYSDILIRTQNKIGIVVEVKYAPDGDLKRGCAQARTQIQEKKYDAALQKEGMEKILRYGIAFFKKNCKVVVE